MGSIYKKIGGRKSLWTVPLIITKYCVRIGCDFPMWMQYCLVGYMASFLLLFSDFYYKVVFSLDCPFRRMAVFSLDCPFRCMVVFSLDCPSRRMVVFSFDCPFRCLVVISYDCPFNCMVVFSLDCPFTAGVWLYFH